MSWPGIEDFADYLRVDPETLNTNQAELVLRAAIAAIKSEADQQLDRVADDTVTLVGNWTRKLQLPQIPVTAVADIAIANGAERPVTTSLAEAAFTWDRFGRVMLNSGYWGGARAAVTLTYSHGYDPIPEDLYMLCLRVAARLHQNPAGVVQETIGGYSVSYAREQIQSGLLDDERRIARGYGLWLR